MEREHNVDSSDEDMPVAALCCSKRQPVSNDANANAPSKEATMHNPIVSDSDDEDMPLLGTRRAKNHGNVSSAAAKAAESDDDLDALLDEEAPAAANGGRRLRKGSRTSQPQQDSDDARSDGDEGSGDEYVPSPAAKGAKHRRSAKASAKGERTPRDLSEADSSDGGPTLDKKSSKRRRNGTRKERPAKQAKRKPARRKASILSESEGDEAAEVHADAAHSAAAHSAAETKKRDFSDAPRKDVDVRRLPNSAFLVVPSLAKRSEWKLPFKDLKGRVNVHMLHAARAVVRSKMSNKKPVSFAITPELERKVERLWRDAKAWHQQRKSAKSGEEAADPSAIEGTEDDAAEQEAVGASPAASDGEWEGSNKGDAAEADDEEAAYLAQYEQEHERAQVKEHFWRRDAFIVEDGDEDEEEEEDDDAEAKGGEEDEALEERERRAPLPVRVDQLNEQQMYDLLHSETQRLLRKQKGLLPCKKDKACSLSALMSNIERRHAEARAEVAPAQQPKPEEAEEPRGDKLVCTRCAKRLTARDEPVVSRQDAGDKASIFCSTLCLRMHRAKAAAGAETAAGHAQAAGDEGGYVSGGDEEDELVVLPSGATPKAARSRVVLQRLVSNESAISVQARGSFLRRLRGDATGLKKEGARISGKYVETESQSIDFFQTPPIEEEPSEGEETALSEDGGEAEADLEVEDESEFGAEGVEALIGSEKCDTAGEPTEASVVAEGAGATAGIAGASSATIAQLEQSPVDGLDHAIGTETPQKAASDCVAAYDSAPAEPEKGAAVKESGVAVGAAPALAEGGVDSARECPANASASVGPTLKLGRTFARKPQQSKLGFGALRAGPVVAPVAEDAAATLPTAIPSPIEEALEALEQEQQAKEQQANEERASRGVDAADEDDENARGHAEDLGEPARQRSGEDARSMGRKSSLVADEAEDSEDLESGGSDAEGEDEDDEAAEEEGEEKEGGDGSLFAEHARLEAEADAAQLDAVMRELRTGKRGRRADADAPHKPTKRRAAHAEQRDGGAARRSEPRRSRADDDDDDASSMDDFIASDDEEEDEVVLEEEVEASGADAEEEEDDNAKMIRAKLGDDWIAGDKSAPALLVADDAEQLRGAALRESIRRRREMEVSLTRHASEQLSSGAEQSGVDAWTLLSDERSTSMWNLLSEKQAAAKKPQRQHSAPKQLQPSRAAAANAASSNPVNAPPSVRKVGSFHDKRGSDLGFRLGAAPSSSMSKGFVFRDENSSHAPSGDGMCSGQRGRSSFGAEARSERAPLRQVSSSSAQVEKKTFDANKGGSLLSRVLGGSKNWAASKRA